VEYLVSLLVKQSNPLPMKFDFHLINLVED
jgi:hypothetical protein